MATQYHPEYRSRPLKPSPPFLGLILAASNQLDAYLTQENTDLERPVSRELLGKYVESETGRLTPLIRTTIESNSRS